MIWRRLASGGVALVDFLFDVAASFAGNVAGLAPARPVWLRRLVQALWVLLGVALLALGVVGLLLLIRSLVQPRS